MQRRRQRAHSTPQQKKISPYVRVGLAKPTVETLVHHEGEVREATATNGWVRVATVAVPGVNGALI